MAGTYYFTCIVRLWRQGTPHTELGDAFQGITRHEQEGARALSEIGP